MMIDTIVERAKRKRDKGSLRLAIPVNGQLLKEFQSACIGHGVTKENTIAAMMRDFVEQTRSIRSGGSVPGARIELVEEGDTQ